MVETVNVYVARRESAMLLDKSHQFVNDVILLV